MLFFCWQGQDSNAAIYGQMGYAIAHLATLPPSLKLDKGIYFFFGGGGGRGYATFLSLQSLRFSRWNPPSLLF